MDSAALRKRIKARLAELGRGPIEAAVKAGLERSYISDFVSGKKRSIKIDAYPKVAAALDWSVRELTETTSVSEIGGDRPPQVSVPEYDIRAGAAFAGGLPSEEYAEDAHGNAVLVEGIRFSW